MGDCQAITALVERYERAAVATAWSILGDFHLAEDVAQESFVGAFRQLTQLQTGKAFGSWLMTCVRRNSIQEKKRRRLTTVDFSWSESAIQQESWTDEFRDVLPMLSRLPAQEHEVVILRYINGLSVNQIADETGRPIGTVTKQLSRAISRLREIARELEK